MGDEKLDKNGLIKVWLKIWTLIKLIVGDVDIVGKGDLQTQINNMGKRVSECFQSASDGKNLLADAITGKGVPTEANDTFATMAENISNIKEADDSINEESPNYRTGYNAGVAATKKGTAGTGDVLTGKTFTNASSVEAAGAMANKGAVTVDSGPVTQDDTYTYLAVPAAAFYNANSKLRTKNSNIFAKSKIAVKSLAAFIPSGSGSATTQAVFTLPKACQLLEIEYSVTGGYYYSNELFIDNVSYGEGYPSKTISKTNVPAGTEIRLVAKRNNPDNLQSSVSANASIAYVHRI